MEVGIAELADYGDIENEYIKKYYPGFTISRHVVLYGGSSMINNPHVAFVLTTQGEMITTKYTPEAIVDAVNNAIKPS
jgi:hypothetical protein